jgi:mono/diheme cytochrome c family protein
MRDIIMRIILLAILVVAVPVSAQEPTPAGSAQRGYQSYMKYMCHTCHGTVGQGADRGAGPKLTPGILPYPAFTLQVRAPRLDMPAYRRDFLSDQELADMYAYLLTIKTSPAAKDIPLLKFE